MVCLIVLGLRAIHSQLGNAFRNVLNPVWGHAVNSDIIRFVSQHTMGVLSLPAGSQMSNLQMFVADTLGR